MKTAKAVCILAILVVVLTTSCQVEKRRYRKGYSVGKNTKTEKTEVKADSKSTGGQTTAGSTTTAPVTTTPAVTTTQAPKQTAPAPEYKGPEKINKEYSFTVKVGPRPDKKGPKKYPMGMH